MDGAKDEFVGDDNVGVACRFSSLDGEFENVEELAGIASTLAQHGTRFFQLYLLVFEKNVAGERIVQEQKQVVLAERFQNIDLTAGEQWANDFEGGVLGGGTNERDNSLFHSSEQ